VRELGTTGVDARIVNISETGVHGPDHRPLRGRHPRVADPAGPARANAVVKWTAGDKLGAEFADPISLEGLIRR
jgi:hypothetical protein